MSPGWVEGNHHFRESLSLLPAPTERSEDLGLDMGAGVNGRVHSKAFPPSCFPRRWMAMLFRLRGLIDPEKGLASL